MHIFDIWTSVRGKTTRKQQQVVEVLLESFNDVENIDIRPLHKCINKLCKTINVYWKNVNRHKSKFLVKYCDWLDIRECVQLSRSVEQSIQGVVIESEQGPSRGRPRKEFVSLSKRSKWRRLAALQHVDESAVRALLTTSDDSIQDLTMNIGEDEVLSLLVEAKLTKHQYLLIKNFINSKTSYNILPSYDRCFTIGSRIK